MSPTSIGQSISLVTAYVTAAASGQQGLDAFEERDFDIIVTDLKMAPMDGLEVVRRTQRAKRHGLGEGLRENLADVGRGGEHFGSIGE